jgi:hypothetical protein
VAAKARGRLGGRPEKYGEKDIEMMKALIDGGDSKTNSTNLILSKFIDELLFPLY